MPTEPDPPTLAQVVTRAVSACELGEVGPSLDDLLERFEDADEPVRGAFDLDARVGAARAELDPEGDDPSLAMASAVVLYLAHRPEELHAPPETLLRLAARAEYDGRPPSALAGWLSEAGVEV